MVNKHLTEDDYIKAANRLGCEIAAIKAVVAVEAGSGGGFLASGKPKILFESHWFNKLTNGKYLNSHPDIATSKWIRNYVGGEGEYNRLEKAASLNTTAALKSTSWGLFQIMGFNHNIVGYNNIFDFVEDMHKSEKYHLDAFILFIINNNLQDEIVNKDWTDFAYSYNGPGYKKNNYDTRLENAYNKYLALGANNECRILFLSNPYMSGSDVTKLQEALKLPADGVFGPNTKKAVMAYQLDNNLIPDGIAGRNTLKSLGLWD